MVLSQSNEQDFCIVIPTKASPREEFAAEELHKYIRKLCGADLIILCDCDESQFRKNKLLIGSPGRNRISAQLIDSDEFGRICPGPEGIFLKSFDSETVLIAGSEGDLERGTVYAVYELLERYLGASLAAFSHPDTEAGELVPQCDCLDLSDIDYIKPACSLPYRTAIVQYADAAGDCNRGLNLPFLDWLCKNRYNRILTWARCYEDLKRLGILTEAERRGIRFTVGHHDSSKLFLPPHGNEYFPEHYYETHPDYYKLLDDGTRYEDTSHTGQWVFCSRSNGLVETLGDNIIYWIEKNPLVDVIAFWPNDGIHPQCACTQCASYSKVENYTYVLNAVAKRVSHVFPQVKIDILAYTDLFECPKDVKLEKSLMIDESTWHESGLRAAGKPDGSCLIGTLFESNLLKWHKAGADVVFYDYYMGVYPARQRYFPIADELQAIFRSFEKTGISGSGTQIECFNLWNHLFNFYCFARTAYDTELSMDDHLARFCLLFGKGAGEIREIIQYAEAMMDGQEPIDTAGLWLIKHIDKAKVYALYEKALDKADTPLTRNNIRLMRMAFRYTDLEHTLRSPDARDMEDYRSVNEYTDESGELQKMCEFDSFWKNNPGFGIDIPAKAVNQAQYPKDYWYQFD